MVFVSFAITISPHLGIRSFSVRNIHWAVTSRSARNLIRWKRKRRSTVSNAFSMIHAFFYDIIFGKSQHFCGFRKVGAYGFKRLLGRPWSIARLSQNLIETSCEKYVALPIMKAVVRSAAVYPRCFFLFVCSDRRKFENQSTTPRRSQNLTKA